MGIKKILIIEDNIDLAEAYELVFKKDNFEVCVVYDGKQAIETLKKFTPDIILLDIMMPYMNGFEFLQKTQSQNKGVKIIINSNLSQDADVKKGMQLGALAYLRKSDYTALELVEQVKKLLAD